MADTKPVETKPAKATPIPQIAVKTELQLRKPAQPDDDQYTDGIYVMSEGPLKGEPFALCIAEPDAYENTHFLKNSVHSWQGKADAFKLTFDKQ